MYDGVAMERPALGETSSGLPPNVSAGIACIFPLVGGVIMLLVDGKNRFVRFYALQSIIFALAWALFNLVIRVSIGFFHFLPLIGGLVRGLLWLAFSAGGVVFFVCWLVAIIKAFSGVQWHIPYIGKIASKQIGG